MFIGKRQLIFLAGKSCLLAVFCPKDVLNHLLHVYLNSCVLWGFFLFKGAFADAIAHLQNFSSTIKENMQLRSNLQMACCFYCLHRYSVSILNGQYYVSILNF